MITVIYRQRDGTDKHQDFTDPVKAFDKFYRMLKVAWRSPFIASDEHIGSFDYHNVEWYMLNDEEGKALAFKRFEVWLKDFKKV
jgi:hypothetical protein